jgi:hypothetical protein
MLDTSLLQPSCLFLKDHSSNSNYQKSKWKQNNNNNNNKWKYLRNLCFTNLMLLISSLSSSNTNLRKSFYFEIILATLVQNFCFENDSNSCSYLYIHILLKYKLLYFLILLLYWGYKVLTIYLVRFTPPSFPFIPPPLLLRIVSTGHIVSFSYKYFHCIRPSLPFPYVLPPSLVLTPRQDLFYFPVLHFWEKTFLFVQN